ncbi:mitochondrial tRNA-specific 2-thiouridylase 1 isoform X1 [Stomoxys calcitrans]|uniref:tRNA-5-taurinomethyluridine 2-sulfurtransferase n=2 Tax=Stomoxys calcitrans TaxID=35570 RepID=A0A1I8P8N8_STOCA|nr:mitochondrial tRNA-specific 2-thiouridylase 1 isoform X1 [Stomoxys calcitrans]
MFRKVAVGISGGVDSAVSAFLLKEHGYEVLGVFMRNWDEFDELGRCSGEKDLLDAEYACNKLGIELKQVNYVKQYWNSVFTSFLEDYEIGLTPNPDILCNKHIKFDLFYNYALYNLQNNAIATGHYAKTNFGPFLEKYQQNEDIRLLIPKDTFKDQTFFLSGIKRHTLRRTMFPLANFLKAEVKELAIKCGLERLTQKKESTGLCFVGKRDFKEFIKEYIKSKPGDFVDIDTNLVVGHHEGIHQWTIGQRCRLHSFLKPYYVAQKDVTNNTIYVAAGHENPALYSNQIIASNANWFSSNAFEQTINGVLKCRFRFQHTKPLVNCSIYRRQSAKSAQDLIIELDKPLRAITPGQYAVFYSDTDCIGSARILSARNFKAKPQTREIMEN